MVFIVRITTDTLRGQSMEFLKLKQAADVHGFQNRKILCVDVRSDREANQTNCLTSGKRANLYAFMTPI
jgi:hypothetical protein